MVGVAANGRIALEKMKSTSVDLLTLDLEMPELNGIETLKELKRLGLSTKVIVFSSVSKDSAVKTLEALNLGATDFVAKPGSDRAGVASGTDSTELLRQLLVPKIEELFRSEDRSNRKPVPMTTNTHHTKFAWQKFSPEAIVIGCSTGGPTALEKIFASLRGPFRCPILIVQHMPPVFTASLATRIGNLCGVSCSEGVHDELVTPNRIYIAPGNYHMKLARHSSDLKIEINQKEQENSVRPAVDPLFRSAAEVFHNNCLGLILTGMGKDGLQGCQHLRQSANPVIIQNRNSCVVFGMPGAVYEAAAFDSIQDLDQITETLRSYLQMGSQAQRGVG